MAYPLKLQRARTALLVIDVQEKLIQLEDRSAEVLKTLQKVIKGFHILKLPVVVTEQYPQGLGPTVAGIKSLFPNDQYYFRKTAFSCCGDPDFKNAIAEMKVDQWVLVGIEAHVCILQTAKDLVAMGHEVIVLNDAITSRSVYDFSTAIAEMRDCGIRISCCETVLFELLDDSQAPEFKMISQLLK